MLADIVAWVVLGAISGYLAGSLVEADEGLGDAPALNPRLRLAIVFHIAHGGGSREGLWLLGSFGLIGRACHGFGRQGRVVDRGMSGRFGVHLGMRG